MNRTLSVIMLIVSRCIVVSIIIVYILFLWTYILSFNALYNNLIGQGDSAAFEFIRTILHVIFSFGGVAAIFATIFLIRNGGRQLWFSVIIAIVFFLEYFSAYFTFPFFIIWVAVKCFWAVILFNIYKNVVCRKDREIENGENQTPVDHD